MNYSISISLYSDDLYPEDYSEGQENTYDLTEEQYNHIVTNKWKSVYDIEEYIKETSNPDNIYEAEEYQKGLCGLDNVIFDYVNQKYLEDILEY